LNEAAGTGATDDRSSFLIDESEELQWLNEPGSAVTLGHISNTSTVFRTMDERVTAIKDKYQTMNDQAVQEVPSLLNLFCVLTVIKWCKTTLEA
jgi:hypothetical protein